jgi:hypothetical protein
VVLLKEEPDISLEFVDLIDVEFEVEREREDMEEDMEALRE